MDSLVLAGSGTTCALIIYKAFSQLVGVFIRRQAGHTQHPTTKQGKKEPTTIDAHSLHPIGTGISHRAGRRKKPSLCGLFAPILHCATVRRHRIQLLPYSSSFPSLGVDHSSVASWVRPPCMCVDRLGMMSYLQRPSRPVFMPTPLGKYKVYSRLLPWSFQSFTSLKLVSGEKGSISSFEK